MEKEMEMAGGQSIFDKDGRHRNPEKLIKDVRTNGLEPMMRDIVWPFLLDVYDLKSTREWRTTTLERKRGEYYEWRQTCLAYSKYTGEGVAAAPPEILIGIGDFGGWQTSIRKDAVRANILETNYSSFQSVSREKAKNLAREVGLYGYEGEDTYEPHRIFHAARIVSIMEVYLLNEPNDGYAQEMSYILSPIIAIIEDDVVAYGCFVKLMEKRRHMFNYEDALNGFWRECGIISNAIKNKDLELHTHLKKLGADNCFFIHRILVMSFRIELSLEQTLSLWEIVWAEDAAFRAGLVTKGWWWEKLRVPPKGDLMNHVIVGCVLKLRENILQFEHISDITSLLCDMVLKWDVSEMLQDAREIESLSG